MTRTEIIDALHAWEALRSRDTDLINIFGQGDSFIYKLSGSVTSASEYIHAYPGIDSDSKLVMILIPSEFDTEDYDTNFNEYASVELVVPRGVAPEGNPVSSTGNNRITDTDAEDRIDLWNNDYATWIPRQTSTTDGIFQAFAIPVDSFEADETQILFSLDPSTTLEKAELIVLNKTTAAEYYDDFIKSVPPFGSVLPLSSFYLLSL